MLQLSLGVMTCISVFQKPCVSKTAGLSVKDTSRSLCYPVLCGHCLPSCQAERQAPGLIASSAWLRQQSSWNRNSPVVRPSAVRLWHRLSLNLLHGFLSNFGSCFPWAICPDVFYFLKTKLDFLRIFFVFVNIGFFEFSMSLRFFTIFSCFRFR